MYYIFMYSPLIIRCSYRQTDCIAWKNFINFVLFAW